MGKGDHKQWDLEGSEKTIHFLRLFVAGNAPASVRAINNLKIILERHLQHQYELEIIDVHQQPQIAEQHDVSAVPLLIKKLPVPKRLLIGDMSDTARVLRGLGIIQQ